MRNPDSQLSIVFKTMMPMLAVTIKGYTHDHGPFYNRCSCFSFIVPQTCKMPRVLTEKQKAANRQRAKEWRIKAKQKGPEYLEAAKLYSRVSMNIETSLED